MRFRDLKPGDILLLKREIVFDGSWFFAKNFEHEDYEVCFFVKKEERRTYIFYKQSLIEVSRMPWFENNEIFEKL